MKTVLIIHHSKPASLFGRIVSLVFYKTESSYCQDREPMIHYLRNLIETMIGNKCNSGIFVTSHNLSLPEYIKCLRDFAKTNKVKFIIIK